MRKMALLLALLYIFTITMASASDDEPTWVSSKLNTKLFMGWESTTDSYTIKAVDFSDTTVFITIEDSDGNIVASDALTAGSTLTYENEVKVRVNSVVPNYHSVTDSDIVFKTDWDPYAIISTYVPGKPSMSIEIETDQDEYHVGEDDVVKVRVNVKNTGTSKADDIKIYVDSTLERDTNTEWFKYSTLTVNNEVSTDIVKFTLPDEIDLDTNATINVFVEWNDTDGFHTKTAVKTIDIVRYWKLAISKSWNDVGYYGSKIYFTVSIRNTGEYDIDGITYTDSLPAGMELVGNATLNETFDLAIDESKVIKYTALPTKTGSFTVPAAKVTFANQYGVNGSKSSASGTVHIYGAYINASKTAVINDDGSIDVSIYVKNNGNVDCTATIEDSVPDGSTVLSGDLSVRKVLKSKSVVYNNYTLSTECVILPACNVSFVDLNNKGYDVSTNQVILYEMDAVDPSIDYEDTDTGNVTVTPEYTEEKTATPVTYADESESGGLFKYIILIIVVLIVFVLLNP